MAEDPPQQPLPRGRAQRPRRLQGSEDGIRHGRPVRAQGRQDGAPPRVRELPGPEFGDEDLGEGRVGVALVDRGEALVGEDVAARGLPA